MDLSIEIPKKSFGSVNLAECMKNTFTTEKMIGTGYKCENCKKEVDIEKDMSIYRLPKILVIHLKRFIYNFTTREKISTSVKIPPDSLDMSHFSPLSMHNSINNCKYKLFGLSHHMGGLSGGHYNCDVLNVKTGKWYHCDDSSVSGISGPSSSSSSAYVLFYVQ
jgi:ubiquitin C-terminal hydrolase